MEVQILKRWEDGRVFERSVSQRDGAPEFVFYDGPPFATGLPHFGHFVPGTIKDVVPRYHTMRGKKVERRFGWDCHGLPVEYEMEKELGISGKRQIEEYGVGNFNEACRSIVLRYTEEWRRIVTRSGRWVDFDNDYKTMEPAYMETIWWIVKRLWEQDLLYEGYYSLPYCPRCSTALSNFELNLGGYEEVQDPAITVRFKLNELENTYALAWTTTPWTLPSNLGLAFGPDVQYARVRDLAGDEYYILAEERIGDYYRSEDEYEIVDRMTGDKLGGMTYEPLFPYFTETGGSDAFRTHVAEFVTTEEGTGIVHIAPGFGEDDYNLLKDRDVAVITPLDAEGQFTAEVSDFAGMYVKDADKPIIKKLKEESKLVKRDTYTHAYPHCWRCKSPLIYRAIASWFVRVGQIKPKMLAANNSINWVPSHLRDGRFGNWLENARDWAISRNRYWGNPMPIWRCDSCDRVECIGSREELAEKSGVYLEDLHKHYVDEVTYPCSRCDGTMRRIPEVLDCWFESGAMPYAQNHYPFEKKEWFERNFPADFISEGLDQTRGWFYTLTVLAAALFDGPAFKNVVVNGLVLAPDGKKMSKSARNYTDPNDVIESFGADALRLFMMHSTVVRGEDLKYDDDGVRDVLKSVIIPLWNAYSFFVTYANIDGITPTGAPSDPGNPLDRWILSETERLVADVTLHLDGYELQKAIDPILNFIDLLNNWYIRRSRRRFWRSVNDSDKRQAYETLHSALMRLVLVAAPIIPFITEEMYRNLRYEGMPDSVHLCDYPHADTSLRDYELERKMEVVRKAVSMGRALRSLHNLKTRQPLRAFHVVTRDAAERRILIEMEDIIREELNVKDVVFRENEEEVVEYSAKANFKELGGKLGRHMKAAAAKIEALTMAEIQQLMDGATLHIDLGETAFDLLLDGIIVRRIEKENLKVLNDGSLTVALDSEVTDDLKREGLIRDLIRVVQNHRKQIGLDVTDRIELVVFGEPDLQDAVDDFGEHLSAETLAVSVKWEHGADAAEYKVGDATCYVSAIKAPGA